MKYTGKALENLWNLLQEIEEEKQFIDNQGKIRLPRYPNNSNMDANEVRKNMLGHLLSLEAIKDLHKVNTRRGNEDYPLWAFFEDTNYQKVFDDVEGQYKVTDIPEHEIHTFHHSLELIEEGNIPKIKKDGLVIFTFPNNWSCKYRYFKCLWQNQGIKKGYKAVYESESSLKYPEKDVWRINRNMRNTINKLRKELKAKSLPIEIETNKGFMLAVQNP